MALVINGSTKTFNDDSSWTKKNRRCFPCLPQGFFKKYGALFRLGIIVATPLLLLPVPLVIQSSVRFHMYKTSHARFMVESNYLKTHMILDIKMGFYSTMF